MSRTEPEPASQERSPIDKDANSLDEAEENEQLRRHYQQQFKARTLMQLRQLCKQRQLKIRGSKDELVERLAENEIAKLEELWF